jgi:5-oxoprolinase (ATP-hydrolysing) subunit A
VVRMVEDRRITTVSGRTIPVEIDTICVHGDNPAAVAMARAVREALEGAGVTIAPFAIA